MAERFRANGPLNQDCGYRVKQALWRLPTCIITLICFLECAIFLQMIFIYSILHTAGMQGVKSMFNPSASTALEDVHESF
jgi:hypothetical protein